MAILALIFNVSLLVATLLLAGMSYLAIHDPMVGSLSGFMFQFWIASLVLGGLTLLMPRSPLKIIQIITVLLVIGLNTSFMAPYLKPLDESAGNPDADVKAISCVLKSAVLKSAVSM